MAEISGFSLFSGRAEGCRNVIARNFWRTIYVGKCTVKCEKHKSDRTMSNGGRGGKGMRRVERATGIAKNRNV